MKKKRSNHGGRRAGAGRRSASGVTNEQIVKVWQKAESSEAAAQALGLDRPHLNSRVFYLRKRGVALKSFRSARIDKGELVRLRKLAGVK